jgi:hypothetical protein
VHAFAEHVGVKVVVGRVFDRNDASVGGRFVRFFRLLAALVTIAELGRFANRLGASLELLIAAGQAGVSVGHGLFDSDTRFAVFAERD